MKNKLSEDQKIFINNKVKELGSLDKVKEFYNQKCLVDKFAISSAKKLYKKGKRNGNSIQ